MATGASSVKIHSFMNYPIRVRRLDAIMQPGRQINMLYLLGSVVTCFPYFIRCSTSTTTTATSTRIIRFFPTTLQTGKEIIKKCNEKTKQKSF